VEKAVAKNKGAKIAAPSPSRAKTILIEGARAGAVKRTAKGITLSLEDGKFATWVENQAQDLINELHTRWQQGGEK
jgi:ParB family chromosome partitioning protein